MSVWELALVKSNHTCHNNCSRNYANFLFLPLYSSISLHDTSDEEFELSSEFGNDYEGVLLLRIRKLESEITDLQSRLEQNKSRGLEETAENVL